MGQSGSAEESGAARHESENEPVVLNPDEAKRHIERARLRIHSFRVRAGADDICAHLLSSWKSEKKRVIQTWVALSDPARRGLIMSIREKVAVRARVLHAVVAPRSMGSRDKNKLIRKLMEKVAFELFDTSVVYDDRELPQLVEDILKRKGGGPEVPFGLQLEVDSTFDPDVRRFSMVSILSKDGGESVSPNASDSDGDEDTTQQHQRLIEETYDVYESKAKSSKMVTSRSANSLQGYYSADRRKTARRSPGSKAIHKLLSFVPASGMDPISRKNLTLELLLEMRNAFLVHFAILVFSELFDDPASVVHKYEYDSNSDTDVGQTDTDLEEIEEEDEDDAESRSTHSSAGGSDGGGCKSPVHDGTPVSPGAAAKSLAPGSL